MYIINNLLTWKNSSSMCRLTNQPYFLKLNVSQPAPDKAKHNPWSLFLIFWFQTGKSCGVQLSTHGLIPDVAGDSV